jgi:hypothetical protein
MLTPDATLTEDLVDICPSLLKSLLDGAKGILDVPLEKNF